MAGIIFSARVSGRFTRTTSWVVRFVTLTCRYRGVEAAKAKVAAKTTAETNANLGRPFLMLFIVVLSHRIEDKHPVHGAGRAAVCQSYALGREKVPARSSASRRCGKYHWGRAVGPRD